MEVTLTDAIAKSISLIRYDQKHGLEGTNNYDMAKRIISDLVKIGVKLPEFEAIYKNGDYYLKQLDGRYFSLNSLKYLDITQE